jgi:hypothetical protein
MKSPIRKAFLIAALTISSSTTVQALDLRRWIVPLTDRGYDSIQLSAVHAESRHPQTEWEEQIRSKNSDVLYDMTIKPIVGIEITRRDPEEIIDSFEPLMGEARQAAAQAGANLLYPEKILMEEGRLNGVRFKGYRVEYKGRVVSPSYLASLPESSVQAPFLEEELTAWEKEQWGTTRSSFHMLKEKKVASQQAAYLLEHVKKGTPIRVILKDGSDFKGTYTGLDDDDQLWLQPDGWTGILADRSFQVKDIQRVGLFN